MNDNRLPFGYISGIRPGRIWSVDNKNRPIVNNIFPDMKFSVNDTNYVYYQGDKAVIAISIIKSLRDDYYICTDYNEETEAILECESLDISLITKYPSHLGSHHAVGLLLDKLEATLRRSATTKSAANI